MDVEKEAGRYRSKVIQGHEGMKRNVDFILSHRSQEGEVLNVGLS